MPIVNCQASFQNSRVKPRPATTLAQTGRIIVGVTEVVIDSDNENRTYLEIRNQSTTDTIFFGYPSQFGSLLTQGMPLKPGESYNIETQEEVRAVATAPAELAFDRGEG
jgi:hypothetical protein